MRPSRATRRRAPRRGVAIIYGVVALAVLIALCSLAVDYGRAQLVRTELQSCTDGAARAAASGLGTGVAEAKRRARELAALNRANGSPVTFTDADFRFGKWDANGQRIDTSGTPVDAVQVTARRTVSLFFGGAIGKNYVDVAATATARKAAGAPNRGFTGLNGISFKNNAIVGSYRASVTTTPTEVSSTGGGIIASNATIEFQNNATVHGDIVLGPGGDVVRQNNLTVTGSTATNASPITAPADPHWDPSAVNPNGVPQAYTVFSATVLPGGTYYFTSLTVSKSLTFAGPATVYVNGNIYADDAIVTHQHRPSNLTIFVIGTNRMIDFQKAISLYAHVQAPGAALVANNKLCLYGTGIYGSIDAKNNAEFYFDQDASATGAGGGGGSIVLVQ